MYPPIQMTFPPAFFCRFNQKGRRLIKEWLRCSGGSTRICTARLRRLTNGRASWGWPERRLLARDVADALLTGAIKVRLRGISYLSFPKPHPQRTNGYLLSIAVCCSVKPCLILCVIERRIRGLCYEKEISRRITERLHFR